MAETHQSHQRWRTTTGHAVVSSRLLKRNTRQISMSGLGVSLFLWRGILLSSFFLHYIQAHLCSLSALFHGGGGGGWKKKKNNKNKKKNNKTPCNENLNKEI